MSDDDSSESEGEGSFDDRHGDDGSIAQKADTEEEE